MDTKTVKMELMKKDVVSVATSEFLKKKDICIIFWEVDFVHVYINFSDQCGDDQFYCKDGSRCIDSSLVCNNHPECPDNSDEFDCPVDHHRCTVNEFQCHNGECIPNYLYCNGHQECEDGSDELDCRKLIFFLL